MKKNSHLSGFRLFHILLKCSFIVLAGAETTIDETHQFHLSAEAELIVGCAEDVVVEDIFDAFLGESHA